MTDRAHHKAHAPRRTAEVRATLRELAEDAFGWQGPLPEGDLAEHLDSMQRLSLVVAIEDHYRMAIEPADEDGLCTVEDVVCLIERKGRLD